MAETEAQTTPTNTVDPDEVARFSAMAEQWWDPNGSFAPLHQLNPVRLRYIRDRLAARFDRDPERPKPLAGLRVLDIGCGGGLICEPMTRLGAEVIGVDAAERNIAVARLHAEQSGLDIDYRHAAAEDLAAAGERFDAVLALEIVEHVADLSQFVDAVGQVTKPGGAAIFATLNRTAKSYLFAIVGAEYVLRWLPRGTHDWNKFVRPSELARATRRASLDLKDISGMIYNPINRSWRIGRDTDVNYMAYAERAV